MALTIQSTAFVDGAEIPTTYTCDGDNISPPLTWDGIPQDTLSLVLIMDDPDAPDPSAPKMTWVHWLVYNLPADFAGLAAGASTHELPAGAGQGLNDWKDCAYGGPCPPIGRHRYVHKLYALDVKLNNLHRPTKNEVEAAMHGHILAEASLIGTYQRPR